MARCVLGPPILPYCWCCCCLVAKLVPTLCESMDCSPPPLSMRFARQEYWSRWPFPSSGESPWPRGQTCVSCIGRHVITTSHQGSPLLTLLPKKPYWFPSSLIIILLGILLFAYWIDIIPYCGLDLHFMTINEFGQLSDSLTVYISSSMESLFMSFACFFSLGYLHFPYCFVWVLICIFHTSISVLLLKVFFS